MEERDEDGKYDSQIYVIINVTAITISVNLYIVD